MTKQSYTKRVFPALLLLLSLFLSPRGFSFPNVCLKSFKKLSASELRHLTPEFEKRHSPTYSLEIKNTPISDQCNYGSCWVHARLAHIEETIKSKTGKDLKLNRHYLIAQSLLDRIDDALESPNSPIFQGGNANYADELVSRYGLVPENATSWKPRINFEKNPHGSRLTYYLNARAAKFHEDAKDLMPESKAYLDLQDQARKDMRDILRTYTGTLPRKFDYQGKSYTPKQFAKEHAKDYTPRPLWVYPEVEELTGNLRRESSLAGPSPLPNQVRSSRESLEKIEKRIVQSLKNGQSVTLSYENNLNFIDRDTGIMTLDGFNTPAGFAPPKKLYRDSFLSGAGYHAVDIVGADLDPDGRVIKFKIKNSWGTQAGDEGFYHMYRDYFENFVTSIYLSDSDLSRPVAP